MANILRNKQPSVTFIRCSKAPEVIGLMKMCAHEGFHSGQGRYSHDTGILRYVVVCDECQAEVREVLAEEYRPQPDPHGNEAFLR